MTSAPRSPQYPWGTMTPRERLRTLSEKLRGAMKDTSEPGFFEILNRVQAAVHAVHPLVETMDHLSRSGLRPMNKKGASAADSLPAADVASAVQSVNAALGGVVSASIHDATERYQAFADSSDALVELAARVIELGIAGSDPGAVERPWEAFGL